MSYTKAVAALSGLSLNVGLLAFLGYNSIYNVNPGQKAFKFNKIRGVGEATFKEGIHFKIPWFERQVVYNVRSTPSTFTSGTCNSKDLQKVTLSLRVLYRPEPDQLQTIYRNLGMDYDARVLPSVVNEVLRSVVAQYNATTLLA